MSHFRFVHPSLPFRFGTFFSIHILLISLRVCGYRICDAMCRIEKKYDFSISKQICLKLENSLKMSVSQCWLVFVFVGKYRESLDTPSKL